MSVVSPLEGGFTLTFQVESSWVLWAETWPPGLHLWAPTPGLAPECGPSNTNPDDIMSLYFYLFFFAIIMVKWPTFSLIDHLGNCTRGIMICDDIWLTLSSLTMTMITYFFYLKVVPEDVLWQPVQDFVVTTEHLPALSSKAHRVYHTCSQVARQYIIPTRILHQINMITWHK